jgi:hypothetical protein
MCLDGGMDTVLDGGMDTVVVAHAYQGTQSETFCVDSPLSNVSSYVASSYQSAGSSMATSRSLSTKPPLALPKKAKPLSISSLTTSKDHRKTSKEAHAARKDVMELEDMFESAYKVGTTLYSGEFLAFLPQIEGYFGFGIKKSFDVPFTKNPKGGMNAESHREWARELRTYYPTAANRPRHRVLTKTDTGPVCMDADFLSEHRVEGFCHFPGVPNGTEIGAEMDQLFSDFKTNIYNNMEKIWLKKCQVEGLTASVTDEDLVCFASLT